MGRRHRCGSTRSPPQPPPCPHCQLQEFLKVFEQLRDEIVNDKLLAGQPESSKKWVKEVRSERQLGLLRASPKGLAFSAVPTHGLGRHSPARV